MHAPDGYLPRRAARPHLVWRIWQALADAALALCQLVHQAPVGVQAARGVAQHQVGSALDCRVHCLPQPTDGWGTQQIQGRLAVGKEVCGRAGASRARHRAAGVRGRGAGATPGSAPKLPHDGRSESRGSTASTPTWKSSVSGRVLSLSARTISAPDRRAHSSSCSAAAARKVSPAASTTFAPPLLNLLASLPARKGRGGGEGSTARSARQAAAPAV